MKATVHNTIDVMSSQHVSNVSKREAVVSLSVESWDVKTMRTVSVRRRTSARRKDSRARRADARLGGRRQPSEGLRGNTMSAIYRDAISCRTGIFAAADVKL